MTEKDPTRYLVDTDGDPVILRIEGRANYMNCAPVSRLFDTLLDMGRSDFVIDFHECKGMDSTFLGIIAGLALQVRLSNPPGELRLMRLGERNLELIRNLGLADILTIETDQSLQERIEKAGALENNADIQADQKLILRAHRNLIEADEGNLKRFQDVVAFLSAEV